MIRMIVVEKTTLAGRTAVPSCDGLKHIGGALHPPDQNPSGLLPGRQHFWYILDPRVQGALGWKGTGR